MKTNITISIDHTIAEQLKREPNYSEVVNEQLKGYYAVKDCENLELLTANITKIKQILKQNRKKKREIEAQVDKINRKQKLFKKKSLSHVEMVVEIKKRRLKESQDSRKSILYYSSPDQEATRLLKLKGGVK